MTLEGFVSLPAPSRLFVNPNTCTWLWPEIKSNLKLWLKPSYLTGGDVYAAAEDVQLLEDHQHPHK